MAPPHKHHGTHCRVAHWQSIPYCSPLEAKDRIQCRPVVHRRMRQAPLWGLFFLLSASRRNAAGFGGLHVTLPLESPPVAMGSVDLRHPLGLGPNPNPIATYVGLLLSTSTAPPQLGSRPCAFSDKQGTPTHHQGMLTTQPNSSHVSMARAWPVRRPLALTYWLQPAQMLPHLHLTLARFPVGRHLHYILVSQPGYIHTNHFETQP